MLNLWTQILYCCLSSIEGSEKHLISAPVEEALFCMNCLLIHVFEDTLLSYKNALRQENFALSLIMRAVGCICKVRDR